jgi:hypothetical protein
MTEIQFTGNLNGFDYEVTQTFVCGSRITGDKSEYVNTLIIKMSGNVVLDTFWKGKESEAYLRMKARDEVAWFIENQDLFTFDRKKCEHRIPASWSIHHREQKHQINALRVETIGIIDRCSLKMPTNWTDAMKERSHIDIMNGYILNFGYCGGKCPEV